MAKNKKNVCIALLGVASFGLALWFAVAPSRNVAAASEGSVTGVVTDDAGKPMRGAVVTATIKDLNSTVKSVSISRWSDASGKYQITGLKPGSYTLSATAYAYGRTSMDKAIDGPVTNVGFSLKPRWDPTTLSTSEYISAFGGVNDNDKDLMTLEGNCTPCHNLSWIMRRRGQTADEWANFIPNMPNYRMITPNDGGQVANWEKSGKLKEISASLAKYFGPDSPLPTQEQVHHVAISDEALNQTVKIYTPPTLSLDHSLDVGADGKVWFAEYSYEANKVGMFDPSTQMFKEYPLPTPKALPHNFWVARNGMVWFTENHVGKLASIDPETGKITEYPVPNDAGAHVLVEGPTGDIWNVSKYVSRFDPKTEKFTVYAEATGYGLAADSQNNAWTADFQKGTLDRVDPKTGETKRYPVPGVVGEGNVSLRGVAVDAHDNVWFADLLGPNGHSLGKLDPKTGKFSFYRPPTPNYSVYGVLFDKKTGDLWTADYLGGSAARFNPATEKFTVFPFPSAIQMARFFGEGPQGQIWFTDFATGRIVELNTGESKMAAKR